MPQLLAAIAPAVFGAAGTAALVTTAGALTLLGSVVSIGASLLLSAAANALASRRSSDAQTIARELSLPTNAPAYRFVYGECRATGTPVATAVRGEYLWGCYLLNSRPSDLTTITLYLDKREVTLTGDAFDFTVTGGARAAASPFYVDSTEYLRVWVGRGDQTQPPQTVLDQAAWAAGTDEDLFLSTDAWAGRTVIWIKARNRGKEGDQERWVSAPPLVEVEGKWSLVYDPREAGHDPDDPDTWAWSDNHALCVLDALRQNPVRPYAIANIDVTSFTAAADVSDETVALKSGGSEPRYRAAGTVIWNGPEIEDAINPMVVSGAADLIRIGGKLGLAAGEYRAPAVTLEYLLGTGFEAVDLLPGDDLVNELRVSYLSAARGWDVAHLQPWPIPGALAADGGVPAVKSLELTHCPSATQAMRVRKIAGLRLRRQERLIGGELPPEAFNLVAGATVTLSLPAPYNALDGIYEIESLHPALDPLGEGGGVALRMPARLVRHSADPYAWTAATDEEVVVDEPYSGDRDGVAAPGAIGVTTGATVNLNTGGSIIPRIRFAFAPSASAGVQHYEWQSRPDGGDYSGGGQIDGEVRDGIGEVFECLTGAVGTDYDIRVRTVASAGISPWVEITGVTPVVSITLDVPINGAATGGAGQIEVEWLAPNDSDLRSVEIWGSDTNDSGAATLLMAIATAPNTLVSLTETGLGSAVTRYYFARSRGDFGNASPFTASVSATTT